MNNSNTSNVKNTEQASAAVQEACATSAATVGESPTSNEPKGDRGGEPPKQNPYAIGSILSILVLITIVAFATIGKYDMGAITQGLTAPADYAEYVLAQNQRASVGLLWLLIYCLLGALFGIPLVVYLKKVPDQKIRDFMALPTKEQRITFPVLSTYFGEQAFSSFVMSSTVKLSPVLYKLNGDVGLSLASVFSTAGVLTAILFAIMSLVRVLAVAANNSSGKRYAAFAILFVIPMFLMLQIGLKLN